MGKHDSMPVYAMIQLELRKEIFDGSFHPGDMLPSENELCARFSASRETVRKSLQKLTNEGLVYSRPRRGYFVSTPQHNEYTLTLTDHAEQGRYKLKDISVIQPDAEITSALQLTQEKLVIAISNILYDDTVPYAYTVRYMPYDRGYPSVEAELRFAVLPDVTARKVVSFDVYTEIEIAAVSADGVLPQALDCAPGSPLLLIKKYLRRQNGHPIRFEKDFRLPPYGVLRGTSGFVNNAQGSDQNENGDH
ncbi:MAG: GntR family transcriptional regulator [Oscillospiraceae bacterium]|nr:GntR family transcriptional regulator [Oscillospiraceae bacterium]